MGTHTVKQVSTNIHSHARAWERAITKGPGYRVYYTIKKDKIIILLVGGDKSSQPKDIQTAKSIAKEYNNE